MKRRDFLKAFATAGLVAGNPFAFQKALGALDPYRGHFFVTVNADGGWDTSSFCDPVANTRINTWAGAQGVQTISGSPITYAPFAHNSNFFNTHYQNMLVINGIDTQTNAHEAGIRHTWSGKLGHGFPTFSALAAAILGANLPLAYISNGGYKETAGITKYTLMQDPSSLNKLVFTNRFTDYDPGGNWEPPKQYHRTSSMDLIQQAKADRLLRLRSKANLSPKQLNSLNDLFNARLGASQLEPLAATMPDTLVDSVDADGQWNPLMRQAQIALASYEAGLTVAADLNLWGFDTHSNHDDGQTTAIQMLERGINYLWEEAENRNIADKLVVLISSDFGRTPWYNDGAGKDHWPIHSAIIMSKGKTWTNRVIGQTNFTPGDNNRPDNELTASAINPNTLALDGNGIIMQPKHIQQAMREFAGIQDHEYCQLFDLDAESINFFS